MVSKSPILTVLPFFLFLIGCSAQWVDKPERSSTYGWDFTKYTSKGFLFTPERYTGEYESIALLTYNYSPAVRTFKRPAGGWGTTLGQIERSGEWDIFAQGKPYQGQLGTIDHVYLVQRFSTPALLDSLYRMATEMGANACVNLTFKVTPTTIGSGMTKAGPVEYDDWTISCFAIRRR